MDFQPLEMSIKTTIEKLLVQISVLIDKKHFIEWFLNKISQRKEAKEKNDNGKIENTNVKNRMIKNNY